MTNRLIAIVRVLAISKVSNSSFTIKFSYLFIIVKNNTTNMFIVLITNNRLFLIFKKAGIEEITDLSLNLLGILS